MEPLERYFRGIPPKGTPGMEINAGAPFILYIGLAALAHGVLGWGAYEMGDYDSLENQTERRKEKLVDQAREALEKRRSDPNYHPDLTDFLIATETLGKNARTDSENELQIKQLREKFSGYRENLSAYNNTVEQTYFLASQLYYDSFFHYAAAYPNLKNFLDHKKGNCVAQTKMFLAAFSQSGISLPKDYGIGVQVFKNHVQPVLYLQDSSGKVLWVQNLINGKKKNEVIAPIYPPAIVLAGFLKKAGEATPMEFEDLLIARPLGQKEEPGFNGDETEYIEPQPIAWPNSEVLFDGEAPEDGILSPPIFEGDELDEENSQVSNPAPDLVYPDPASKGKSPQPLEIFEYRLLSQHPYGGGGWLDFRVEVKDEPAPPSAKPFVPFVRKIITYFRTPQQRDHFKGLKSSEQKREFLFKLAQGSLRRMETTERFQKAEFIFKNPLKNFLENEMNGFHAWTFLSVEGDFEQFWTGLNLLGLPPLDHSSLPQSERERIFADLPRWQDLHRNITTFRSFISKNPKDVLLMVNQIKTPKARYNFLKTLVPLGHYFQETEPDHNKILGEWITDPKKVGLAAKSNLETPFIPQPDPENWIEVDLAEEDLKPSISNAREISLPEKPSSTSQVEAQVQISPQTMVDLLLHTARPIFSERFPDYRYWERWDATSSAALLERDADSFYESISSSNSYFKALIHYWVLKGLKKSEPKNARAWGRLAMLESEEVVPAELIPFNNQFEALMESHRWKSYLPVHLIPVVNRAEKMAPPGAPLFHAREPVPPGGKAP